MRFYYKLSHFLLTSALWIGSECFLFTSKFCGCNSVARNKRRLGKLTILSSGDDGEYFSKVNPFDGNFKVDEEEPSTLMDRKMDVSSIRSLRMKSLMQDLLEAEKRSDNSSMNDILLKNKNLLLEQFDDMEAPLEPDTIFIVDGKLINTREERFDRYESAMNERINSSQYGSVQNILKAMMEFVLSHDERQS